MDRLTRWNGKKYVLPQGYGAFRMIAERLAAYENTGLEPEEIERMKTSCGAMLLRLKDDTEKGECVND